MSTEETTGDGTEGPQQLLSDVTFVRLGGLSAIVAMAFVIAGIYTHITLAGAPSPPDGMEVYLTIINDNPQANALSPTLHITGQFLLLVFFVALYQLFGDGGGLMRFALVVGAAGLFLLVVSMLLALSEVELAAQYVIADGATQSAVAAVTETVLRVKSLIDLFGNLLAWGVGGLLFSIAILRTSILSRWLGIGGLVYAAAFWATLIEVALMPGVTARDSLIFFLGTLFGIIWLVAMGVGLLRVDKESVAV